MEKLEFESKTLSPLDGRYGQIKDALGDYFSEYALVKYRVHVEIQWLKYLRDHIDTKVMQEAKKRDWSGVLAIDTDLSEDSYKRIKEIENLGGETLVSEGIDSNYMDIINYAVFGAIKLRES